MDKQSKKIIVKDLQDSFSKASGVIVTHYLGLNNAELTDLRSQVKAVGSRFCVAKNSLAKLASKSTDYEDLTGESIGDMPSFFEVNGTIGGYCAGLCFGIYALLAFIGRPKSPQVQIV